MLVVEALFRFQSKEIKDSILNNYGVDYIKANKMDAQAAAQKDLEQEILDENIVFEDEKPIYDVFDEKDLALEHG